MDAVTHVSYTAHVVTATFVLILIAVATLVLTRRIRLPFTVALVMMGMLLTTSAEYAPEWFGIFRDIEISPDLILFIFLPTLIFESTYNLDSQQLRQNLGPVITLAVPGLVLSTLVIGFIVSLLTDIPLIAALLLGAILSATDPVAVIALFKQLGAPKRLIVLVEGESLFNDATSIVLAKILTGILAAGVVSSEALGGGVIDFFVLFLGGLLAGWVFGLIAGWLLGMVESDSIIEISITTATAYLSFLIAEEVLHVSGVMATAGAGLTLGGWGRAKISAPVRQYLDHFWEYLAFIANALIFLLVGMKVDLAALWGSLDILMVTIFAMLIARGAIIYPLMPLIGRIPGFTPVDLRFQTVMYWGGLRGAIALAIVLGLEHFEYADTFVAVVMGAVLFTLLVQGLSIGRVMHWLGLDRPPITDRLAELEYRIRAGETSLERLPELMKGGRFSPGVIQGLSHEVEEELHQVKRTLEDLREKELDREQQRNLLYLNAFTRERSLYNDMFAKGHLSEQAYRQLLLTLSLQVDGIRSDNRFVHIRSHKIKRALEPHLFALLAKSRLLARIGEHWRLNRLSINYENDWAHYQSSTQVIHWLRDAVTMGAVSDEAARSVMETYTRWREQARDKLDQIGGQFPEFVRAVQYRLARRTLLLSDAAIAEEQESQGALPRTMAEEIHHDIRHGLRALRGQEVSQLKVDPVELLRTVPLFAQIPHAEAEALASRLVARTFEAATAVIREGENGESLFLIARGVVRVSRQEGARRKELATLVAGEFFGEMALLHDEPRSATVETVTACSLYELRREELRRAMQEYPVIREQLEAADRRRRVG